MTCAEEIYKVTLEQLAEQGNEQAKLALAMAKQLSTPHENKVAVVTRELQYAEAALHRAIESNSTRWTSATDRRIVDALVCITNAIISIK